LIGQLIFFEHEEVPPHASYATKGRYNGDRKVSGAKRTKELILDEPEESAYENVHTDPVQVSFSLPTKTSIEND
jgi:hypothetical protein